MRKLCNTLIKTAKINKKSTISATLFFLGFLYTNKCAYNILKVPQNLVRRKYENYVIRYFKLSKINKNSPLGATICY